MDARAERSRSRLSAAVLRLAAERDAVTLSVAEVARAAEVHRSTFYEHAESPAGLLRDVLRAELDVLRDRHLRDIPAGGVPTAVLGVTQDVLDHVEAHADVYARALGAGEDASLHTMLSTHFRESIALLVESGAVDAPASLTGSELLARYLADGTVGAIDAWLRRPAPRSREEFLAAYADLVPAWWPLA